MLSGWSAGRGGVRTGLNTWASASLFAFVSSGVNILKAAVFEKLILIDISISCTPKRRKNAETKMV
jgi:hypothetical protein